MHIDLTELLAAHGYPDTPANRDALTKAIHETYPGLHPSARADRASCGTPAPETCNQQCNHL